MTPITTTAPEPIGATLGNLRLRLTRSPEEWAETNRRAAKEEAADQERNANRCVRALAADLGRRYSPTLAAFESYRVYAKGQEEVIDQLRAFTAQFPGVIERGEGLILYGSVGTGKDHLCAAALYAACHAGLSCRWIGGQELYGRFRDQIDDKRSEREQSIELAAPDVLAISDPIPAAGDLSKWSIDQLYRLIDRRYREMRSTWITVNAATPEEAKAKLSAQVFDRLREGATLVKCFWPSFRSGIVAKESQ